MPLRPGVDIFHHGAVTGVTGSCHELRLPGGAGMLVDCGLFQGDESPPHAAPVIGFSTAHLKALLVTHVHIDHVGRIPHLLAASFQGPILCSEPSAVLLPLVLEDAVKVGFTRDRRLLERFDQVLRRPMGPPGPFCPRKTLKHSHVWGE